MKIDVHAHLVGVGTGGSGCWVSPRLRKRWTIRVLRRLVGVSDEQMRTTLDQDWAARLAERVRQSELHRAVALGFDGVYGPDGRLDEARSQMVLPPAWVLRACRAHPELIPGPAVNPFRRDALERLDECAEGGAVLIKWLPATMGIDPSHPSLGPFYRRMADAGIALLVHSGGSEMTFAEVEPRFKELSRVEAPLRAGVTVVVAHAAARVLVSRDPDPMPLLRRMLREHPNLWIDNSGMANPSRFPYLRRAADDPELTERTLFGTDYPVMVNAFWYPLRLGARRVVQLDRIPNPLQRAVEIARALGFPERTLCRAGEVLPNARRWLASHAEAGGAG